MEGERCSIYKPESQQKIRTIIFSIFTKITEYWKLPLTKYPLLSRSYTYYENSDTKSTSVVEVNVFGKIPVSSQTIRCWFPKCGFQQKSPCWLIFHSQSCKGDWGQVFTDESRFSLAELIDMYGYGYDVVSDTHNIMLFRSPIFSVVPLQSEVAFHMMRGQILIFWLWFLEFSDVYRGCSNFPSEIVKFSWKNCKIFLQIPSNFSVKIINFPYKNCQHFSAKIFKFSLKTWQIFS